jgi:hypothetical protein
MTISRINIPTLGRDDLHQLVGKQCQTAASSFQEILNKTILNKTDDFINNQSPLVKSQLTDLITDIKKYIDTKLMLTCCMETGEETDIYLSTHYMDLSTQPQPLPRNITSNKWHTAQNNDISQDFTNLDSIISRAAKTYGVDDALVKSVIKVESNFNSDCTSSKGAMGLMQLMPETARELGVQNPHDPIENVRAGTRYLKMLLTRYDGDVSLALAAYNWGLGNLEKGSDQIPTETKQYVDKVMRHYEMMRG